MSDVWRYDVGRVRHARRRRDAQRAGRPALLLRSPSEGALARTAAREGLRRVSSTRTVVIVGGVAAGMSAATRLRRNDETLRIVVLERGPHVSFANCGLPYHLGGVIEDRDDLLLQTPASLAARFALDVRVRHEVLSIDR